MQTRHMCASHIHTSMHLFSLPPFSFSFFSTQTPAPTSISQTYLAMLFPYSEPFEDCQPLQGKQWLITCRFPWLSNTAAIPTWHQSPPHTRLTHHAPCTTLSQACMSPPCSHSAKPCSCFCICWLQTKEEKGIATLSQPLFSKDVLRIDPRSFWKENHDQNFTAKETESAQG